MKISVESCPEGEESQVIVRCEKKDAEAQQLIADLLNRSQKLLIHNGRELFQLNPDEIFYCEAVDDRTFIYLRNQVVESTQRLVEIEQLLLVTPLFRASKAMLLNNQKIRSVRPLYDGRLEALLENGERVIVSRKYVPDLKRKLGLIPDKGD